VLIRKTPIANPAVVTTPIEASALILFLRVISLIRKAEIKPYIAAPM
jgi:hypothetical protein